MPSLRFQQYLDKFEERFRALHEDKIYPYEDPIRLKKLNGELKVLKKKYKKQYQNHVNKF